MATSRITLKTYFEATKKPTESQFSELIDAFVHLDDDLAEYFASMAEINEAQEGNVTDKYMSPYLTKLAIYALTRLADIPELKAEVDALITTSQTTVEDLLTTHENDVTNPHGVTKAQVGLSNIPNAKSDSYTTFDSNVLATSYAVANLGGVKQDKSSSMRFTMWPLDTSPPTTGRSIGDVYFVGSGSTKIIYIFNGTGWKIL